jgi:hypothetical protein
MTEEQAIYFTIIFMAFTYAAIGFGINKAITPWVNKRGVSLILMLT